MKLARRLIFYVFCFLMAVPLVDFGCIFIFSHPGNAVLLMASLALPAQAAAAFAMLIWCAVFLRVEAGLSRIGILLAALALLLLGFALLNES